MAYARTKFFRNGFTLIELLVVIAIIALLTTVSVVSLRNVRRDSRDTKRVTDVQSIQLGLSMHFNETNAYPVIAAPGVSLGDASNKVLCTPSGATDGFELDTSACESGKVQIPNIPINPLPNGTDYTYVGTASDYTIAFTLEDAVGDLPAGANCARPNGMTTGACPVI